MEENIKNGFVDVLVGLQWGDEGKGKNIDELLSHGIYSGVARFHGGANAGHTLKLGDITFIGHIVPSGCLQNDIELYIGNGVVVDASSLIKEINELKVLGFDVLERLFISDRSKLVFFTHPFIDQAEEFYRSKNGEKIGTTARGIGPAYSDSRARRGLLVGDILLPDFDKKQEELFKFHIDLLKMYSNECGFEISIEKINEAKEKWISSIEEMRKLKICNLSALLKDRLSKGKNILAEGAQGVMLDIDFGDYPNVTSSNSLPANASLGLGIPHHFIRDIYGVIKAYTTKVGGGDFPSRIKDENLEKLFQEAGSEFGATTGRRRMCGWLDLFALKYAIELSGVNKIFINKADICPTDKVRVVTEYKNSKGVLKDFPLYLREVSDVNFEEMDGWGQSNYGISDKSKVSPQLLKYLDYLKTKFNKMGAKIVSVGTGPDRAHSFSFEENQ